MPFVREDDTVAGSGVRWLERCRALDPRDGSRRCPRADRVGADSAVNARGRAAVAVR
jgi:hypothetical protein